MIEVGDEIEVPADSGLQYSNDHTFGESAPAGRYSVVAAVGAGLVKLVSNELCIMVAAAHVPDAWIKRLQERSRRFRAPTLEHP